MELTKEQVDKMRGDDAHDMHTLAMRLPKENRNLLSDEEKAILEKAITDGKAKEAPSDTLAEDLYALAANYAANEDLREAVKLCDESVAILRHLHGQASKQYEIIRGLSLLCVCYPQLPQPRCPPPSELTMLVQAIWWHEDRVFANRGERAQRSVGEAYL